MAGSSREEKRRAPVPKFASYKPKDVGPGSETRPPAEAEEAQKGKDGDKRKKHRHREREEDPINRDRKRRASPTAAQPRNVAVVRDGHHREKTVAVSSSVPEKDIFFFDKRGDPLISKYGGNDRWRIPEYRRFGAGKVLGSDGILCFHDVGSRQQFSIQDRHGKSHGSVFRDDYSTLLASAGRRKTKRIMPGTNASLPTGQDDFIEIEPSKKRKRGEAGLGSPSGPDYRSIYGKAKPGEFSDSDGDVSSADEGPAEMTTTKKRSIELNRQVKQHPGDIESWLELIKLQDALFHENKDGIEVRSADAARGLADLKLSLYEEALPHAVSPSHRERVLDGLIRETSKIGDSEALAKRWDKVTKDDGASFVLWKLRLNFELTRMTTFTYDNVRAFITDKLREVNATLSMVSMADISSVSGQLMYVFLRLTRFLYDSGFAGLAVAAWQAALEMTLFRPSSEESLESALSSFADYWECEASRIGEDGFKGGWKDFVESASMPDFPEPKSEKPHDGFQSRDFYKAWATAEQRAAREARIPARTLDDGNEDDPYKIIIFSDIKDLLIWIPTHALAQAKPLLLDAFLTFCRLPTAGLSRGDHEFSTLLRDPFVASRGQAFEAAFGDCLDARDTPDSEQGAKQPDFRQQGGEMVISQEILFAGQNWFQYLGNWSTMRSLGFDDDVETAWVLGTVRHLVRAGGIEELAEYYLAMEWRNEPTAAEKTAKALLKQYSSNARLSARLYNAYALCEYVNRGGEMPETVLSAACGLGLPGGQVLWNNRAWMHLEAGQKQLSLLRLCSSLDNTNSTTDMPPKSWSLSPASILKARVDFTTTRDWALSSRDLDKAAQYAESLALFEYLTVAKPTGEPASESQGNIGAALSSIWGFCSELKSHNTNESLFYYESLLQNAARLLYFHATHGYVTFRPGALSPPRITNNRLIKSPYRPTYVRAEISKFLDAFPHNAIFLELYAWAHQSTVSLLVNDPVRDFLRRSTDAADNDHQLTMRRFAIQFEMARATSAGATMMSSIKAAFEAALGFNSTCGELRGNIDLWVCYIRLVQSIHKNFTARHEKGDEGKNGKGKSKDRVMENKYALVEDIKGVFYRAIAACPWSKRLYMEAFGEGLIREMDSAELKGVVRTLEEKGLRVHVDTEGFKGRWNEWRERKGVAGRA